MKRRREEQGGMMKGIGTHPESIYFFLCSLQCNAIGTEKWIWMKRERERSPFFISTSSPLWLLYSWNWRRCSFQAFCPKPFCIRLQINISLCIKTNSLPGEYSILFSALQFQVTKAVLINTLHQDDSRKWCCKAILKYFVSHHYVSDVLTAFPLWQRSFPGCR